MSQVVSKHSLILMLWTLFPVQHIPVPWVHHPDPWPPPWRNFRPVCYFPWCYILFLYFLWPQEAQWALLHPRGHCSIRTISELSLCPSHSLPFHSSSLTPSSSALFLINAYTVRHDRPCPRSVATLHSPAALIVTLQTSFISYSSALAHFTVISPPPPPHLSQC